MTDNKDFSIDNQMYRIEIFRNVQLGADATRIIVPTLILNDTAKEMVRVCVAGIQKFTTEDVEIWLVDNNSPPRYARWLTQFNANVNIILNHTEPVNPFLKLSLKQKIRYLFSPPLKKQMIDGSYANAIALELGRRVINPATRTIFTMHYDAIPIRYGWLKYMKSKLNATVRAVGYRQNTLRVKAPHIAGLLLDYTLFESLEMSFLPNMRRERFPNQPEYDTGDQIAMQIRTHNLGFEITHNTFNEPHLLERLSLDNHFRQMQGCDLCFDDDWNVFFMHLGRGIPKSTTVTHIPSKIYPTQWISFIHTYLL